MNAIASGTAAMSAALDRYDVSATRLAGGAANSGVDLETEVARTVEAQASFDISVAVVRSANEMNKRLLDILV